MEERATLAHLFDTLWCKLGTSCYKLHGDVELPTYVTCYIVSNSSARFRNASFAVKNCVFIISLIVFIRPYIKPDTTGMILEKPQHFCSNQHCLTCSHRNPEYLTFNLCCAYTFIHGVLLPFVYTSGDAADVTPALDMQISLY